MTKTVFDQKIVKKCLGFFLFNFAFKQPKEQILFRMQTLKIMQKHIILYSFLGKIQNFQKPYAKWIANIKTCNSGIEVVQPFGTTNKVLLFIFQNHSTLLCSTVYGSIPVHIQYCCTFEYIFVTP